MKSCHFLCGMFVVLTVLVGQPVTAQDDPRTADQEAIRKNVGDYVRAFNRGDAEAVAAHWDQHGEWIAPDGVRLQGRDAIASAMKEFFSRTERPRVDILNVSLRFLTPTVAVEEGLARVSSVAQPPSEASYVALHVKRNGQWLMDSVRETVRPDSTEALEQAHKQLRELDWLLGEWVDEDDHARIETKCEWAMNQSFIRRTFKVFVEDRVDVSGTQLIGWDPESGRFRSWVFDSEGGFGEGFWSRRGDRWFIKSAHVFQNGERASAIRIITPVDSDAFTLEVVGREINGKLQPNIDPVRVVRK